MTGPIPSMDLSTVSLLLHQNSDGIWESRHAVPIDYPAEGNDICFQLEDQSFWFRHRNECIAAITNLYPPGGTIFDVGGGNGFVSSHLQSLGHQVVLVEPGVQGVRNARNRGIRSIVHSTLQDAGFRPNSLPSVGVFDVIEHVSNDQLFLSQITQALQPKGYVYITTPAHQWLWSAEDVYAQHHRRYTRRGLETTLVAAGLQPKAFHYIFWFLPLPIFLFRVIPSRLGIHQAARRFRDEHQPGSRLIQRVLEALSAYELRRLTKGRSLWFGATCLAVAQKE